MGFANSGFPGCLQDGIAFLTPEHNWAGEERIVFTATDDEGSFTDGMNQPVSFDHIELANVDLAGQALTVCATNGDDDVTLTGTAANEARCEDADGGKVFSQGRLGFAGPAQ